MTVPFWLHPGYYWATLAYWLDLTRVRMYCARHDVIHWGWTHRHCGGTWLT